jgi:hypothetical protein
MATKAVKQPSSSIQPDAFAKLRSQCASGSLEIAGRENAGSSLPAMSRTGSRRQAMKPAE